MPVVAWTFLNVVEQKEKYLELGCVDDGLVQVSLNAEGVYISSCFNEKFVVKNGKFRVDASCPGWGVTLSPEFIHIAKRSQYTQKSTANRSFL